MAERIDGKAVSAMVKDELKERVRKEGIEATLAVIQVGDDPASTVYVGNKKKACEYIGIRSLSFELPEETKEEELLDLVRELNEREDVDGILVQLPLPPHKSKIIFFSAIAPPSFVPAEKGPPVINDRFGKVFFGCKGI